MQQYGDFKTFIAHTSVKVHVVPEYFIERYTGFSKVAFFTKNCILQGPNIFFHFHNINKLAKHLSKQINMAFCMNMIPKFFPFSS